jgi:predicted membrane channel-forming protein YqfA (hemolysin III family)
MCLVFITLFYPLSLCDKKGNNFYFWTGIVFSTGQVIFVPEWPKGEFVSLKLATFC